MYSYFSQIIPLFNNIDGKSKFKETPNKCKIYNFGNLHNHSVCSTTTSTNTPFENNLEIVRLHKIGGGDGDGDGVANLSKTTQAIPSPPSLHISLQLIPIPFPNCLLSSLLKNTLPIESDTLVQDITLCGGPVGKIPQFE